MKWDSFWNEMVKTKKNKKQIFLSHRNENVVVCTRLLNFLTLTTIVCYSL